MIASEYRESFLKAVSSKYESASDAFSGEYDMVVVAASWDRRSTALTHCDDLCSERAIVLTFDSIDEEGLCSVHHQQLLDYFKPRSAFYGEINCKADDVHATWEQLLAGIESLRCSLERPLRILVDASTCPRYFSLGILGHGVRYGTVAEVTYAYAEGLYPEEESAISRHDLFTSGGWKAVPVPGLDGEWHPEKRLLYLVSLGFEGSKTYRLVSRAQPDRMCVLIPDPPVLDEYRERTERNNSTLLERFQVPESERIRAAAPDAIEAWHNIAKASLEDFSSENCVGVCCGTKAHSIALALRAVTNPDMSLLYIVPDRHQVVDVRPSGSYWKYVVKDCSSLSAAAASCGGTHEE